MLSGDFIHYKHKLFQITISSNKTNQKNYDLINGKINVCASSFYFLSETKWVVFGTIGFDSFLHGKILRHVSEQVDFWQMSKSCDEK